MGAECLLFSESYANLAITEKEIMLTKSEMAIPSASFSGTEDKDDVDEESDDEVLLIKEHNLLIRMTS